MDNEILKRVIKIREDANLNQVAFAEKLNLSKSTISMYESGSRPYSKRTLIDICEKFNVNQEWLVDGVGEPYKQTSDAIMMLLKAEYDLDDIDIKLFEGYLSLSPIERQVFKDYIKKMGTLD